MFKYVVDAKYIDKYILWIAFDDGLEGKIDLSQKLKNRGGVFKPLADEKYFKNFEIKNDTLTWKMELI